MSVTIKDIALAAGVSRGTVDRVLHERGGVHPDVADKIRQLANDMGFLPNKAGRMLAVRKQPIKIGCLLPGIDNAFFDDVIKGIRNAEHALLDFGVSIIIENIRGFNPKTHCTKIDSLLKQGCSALCLSTVDTPDMRDKINDVISSGIPIITVNNDVSGTQRLCYVGTDYEKGGKTAAGMISLYVHNELKILIVTGSRSMKGHNQRIDGFTSKLKDLGIRFTVVAIIESQDNDEYAYLMTRRILTEHPEVNAVYIVAAGVDGVCRALLDLNKTADTTIMSFDDIPATRSLLKQRVIDFTICQEPEQQGYNCIQIMFEYLLENKRIVPKDCITGTIIKIPENLE